MVIFTYHNRVMSSLCSGNQHDSEADWMGGFEVTEYHIIRLHISFKDHTQNRLKGCNLQCVV